jgi:neutral trehalase
MDCDALSEIAVILGKKDEVNELKSRGDYYRKNLSKLWDDKAGIYKNKRTDTGEFSPRLSPTNFYPMLAKAPTQAQVERMVKEHLLNPEEFYSEWMIPSIARNDPGFKDQDYWRGRIWGPMNFLVYLGLKNYDVLEARKILAEKSNRLMMENVTLNGYVYENYNAISGNVKDTVDHSCVGFHVFGFPFFFGAVDPQFTRFIFGKRSSLSIDNTQFNCFSVTLFAQNIPPFVVFSFIFFNIFRTGM